MKFQGYWPQVIAEETYTFGNQKMALGMWTRDLWWVTQNQLKT